MYYKFTEFTNKINTPRNFYDSDMFYRNLYTPKRMENNIRITCTINGCQNNREKFGGVCYEHRKYKTVTGTYNPTMFNFKNQISIPSKELYKSGYTTPALEELATEIERLYSNPYTHTIEVIKGSWRNSLASSKEKIASYIKLHKPTITPHHLAIRMGFVFKLYNDGDIEAGGQLRFNLAKALLPNVSNSGQGLNTKEVIGNVVLKNYINQLYTIANDF